MSIDKEYKNKLICLIIADALDTSELEDFAANLLIFGTKPLTNDSVKQLEQEVYDRYHHTFDPDEIKEFEANPDAFKTWALDHEVKEWYIG